MAIRSFVIDDGLAPPINDTFRCARDWFVFFVQESSQDRIVAHRITAILALLYIDNISGWMAGQVLFKIPPRPRHDRATRIITGDFSAVSMTSEGKSQDVAGSGRAASFEVNFRRKTPDKNPVSRIGMFKQVAACFGGFAKEGHCDPVDQGKDNHGEAQPNVSNFGLEQP